MIEKVITPNIIRTLQKLKADPSQHMLDLLVDDNFHEDFLKLFHISKDGNDTEEFSLKKEFAETYSILKTMLDGLAKSQEKTTEDLKILNSAQKFLEFILKNEATINGIDSVKNFKSAVFEVLDEADPKLKDNVINHLNSLAEG